LQPAFCLGHSSQFWTFVSHENGVWLPEHDDSILRLLDVDNSPKNEDRRDESCYDNYERNYVSEDVTVLAGGSFPEYLAYISRVDLLEWLDGHGNLGRAADIHGSFLPLHVGKVDSLFLTEIPVSILR